MFDIEKAKKRLNLQVSELAFLLGVRGQPDVAIQKWLKKPAAIPPTYERRFQGLPLRFPYRTEGSTSDPKFRFIDLFAGIGGMRLPFQARGGECVFTAEWDKQAQISYASNFGEFPRKNGDITAFSASEIGDHDVLLAGFPCQTFSQAGRKAGLLDTRGTMFFEIQRILAHNEPSAFLLENVKQLKGHDKGRTLETIMAILNGDNAPDIPAGVPISEEAREALGTKLNYNADFEVFRARDFGLPQNRERIYIVGFHRKKVSGADREGLVKDMFARIYAAREEGYARRTFGEVLQTEPEQTAPYVISEKLWTGHQRRKERHLANGNGFGYSMFNEASEYCNTISARYYKDGSEILVNQTGHMRPRKLTPREAARIQGFPENFHISSVSAAQAYKQFGNSVAVPVIDAIARQMLPILGVNTTEHSGLWQT
jgi:DNA (cytosine-5)-methyltransferase 1